MTAYMLSIGVQPTAGHARGGAWLAALYAAAARPAGAPEESIDLADVRRSLGGDQEAYARLIARYESKITGRLWKFTRDPQALEELAQESFVEAFLSLKSYRGEGPFISWLNRIATRVGYRHWKRQRQGRQMLPLEDWHGAVVNPSVGDDPVYAADQLHSLLAQLRPRDRLVLTLLYWEDCSVAEAAAQTGWSQTMVKVQAHRARKRLKLLLEKAGLLKDEGERQ